MVLQDIIFWLLAAIMLAAALGVVLVRDLFRAALLLVTVFLAVAGFFVLLSAQFLAVVQVLVYAGAVAILLVFAVMLTKDVARGNQPNRLRLPAAGLAGLALAVFIAVAVTTGWTPLPPSVQEQAALVQTQASGGTTPEGLEQAGISGEVQRSQAQRATLADLLLGEYVVPFEAVSVLLLAAAVGSLALLRGRPQG
ncbi:MAG: NADH-quinone oxidoreductase subunit J [SAR202 cluster bacterium]|nr:NADH-quinone oxidoreductase subunit J [SAR202 cluster bacterium]